LAATVNEHSYSRKISDRLSRIPGSSSTNKMRVEGGIVEKVGTVFRHGHFVSSTPEFLG
jgi:hypothetical protein